MSLPVLEIVHTGLLGSAAVTLAVVHCVIFSVALPPRIRFSVVLPNRQMTSPFLALSYACCTDPLGPTVTVQTALGSSGHLFCVLPKSLPD